MEWMTWLKGLCQLQRWAVAYSWGSSILVAGFPPYFVNILLCIYPLHCCWIFGCLQLGLIWIFFSSPDSFLLLLDSVSSVPKCLHPMGSFCNSGSKNVSPFPGPLHSVKHTCSDSSDVTLIFWHEWPGLWVFRSLLTSEIAAPSFPGWGKSHQSLWRVTNVWLIFPNSFFWLPAFSVHL